MQKMLMKTVEVTNKRKVEIKKKEKIFKDFTAQVCF